MIVLTGSSAHALRDLLNEVVPRRPDDVILEDDPQDPRGLNVLVTVDGRHRESITPSGDRMPR